MTDEHENDLSLHALSEKWLEKEPLKSLLSRLPTDHLVDIERTGGIARVIAKAGLGVGFVTVTFEKEGMAAVHPSFQRQGIASRALPLLQAELRKRGIDSVTACAQIGRPSNGLLAKLGAVETGRSDGDIFYRIDL